MKKRSLGFYEFIREITDVIGGGARAIEFTERKR
jgi:hypothetical protein